MAGSGEFTCEECGLKYSQEVMATVCAQVDVKMRAEEALGG